MSQYFIQSRGKVSGPFSIDDLRRMARQGTVSRVDRVSTDRASWRSMAELDSVFAPAPGGRAGAPVAPTGAPATPTSRAPEAIAGRGGTAPPVLTVGRDRDCDIVVDTLAVARRHLALVTDATGVQATDLGSGAETFVNGHRLAGSRLLEVGDIVSLGGVQLRFDGRTLVPHQANPGLSIRVRGLGRQVIDRGTGKPRMLIRDISLSLLPGEFIALVGSAGAGKSTLFGALSGRVRATHGQVLYDGQDLYANFEAFRANIGYVPQVDVFHDMLPVDDALRAVSRLRLSRDTSPAEIEANIDRVLEIVSLTPKKKSIISTLSGGEKKRVSIAMELHARPRILFLDEPTAPLDPLNTTRMMELFRSLADSGITVIMITHAANTLSFCNVVAVVHLGVLTFQGTPDQMKAFYGVTEIANAYAAQGERTPDQWVDKFNRTPENQLFFSSRWSRVTDRKGQAGEAASGPARVKTSGLGAMVFQARVLTARYLRVVTIDRRNLILTLLLAPLVTALLCLITSYMDNNPSPVGPLERKVFLERQNILCFGGVMIVIFLALFGSVREIVKELPIYLREHFVNVEIVPYLVSKLIVLLLIDAVQVGTVLGLINWYGHIHAGTVGLQFGILYLCAAVGTALGLVISALVDQTDHAVTGMIIVVIPQILFSSVFGGLKEIPRLIAGTLITAYWGLNALMHEAVEKAGIPTSMVETKYVSPHDAALVLLGQWVVLVGVTYFLMERKDGPGTADRIVQKVWRRLRMN